MLRRKRTSGFTLIELLVVIVILMLLMALLLPAIIRALCQARQGAAEHMIDQLYQAAKTYELDQNAFPAGDGTGTSELRIALRSKGPKQNAYFEFLPDMWEAGSGNILNPVFAGTGGPESYFYYRNNAAGMGSDSNPTRMNMSSVDIWGYGCSFRSGSANASDAWEISNWE